MILDPGTPGFQPRCYVARPTGEIPSARSTVWTGPQLGSPEQSCLPTQPCPSVPGLPDSLPWSGDYMQTLLWRLPHPPLEGQENGNPCVDFLVLCLCHPNCPSMGTPGLLASTPAGFPDWLTSELVLIASLLG